MEDFASDGEQHRAAHPNERARVEDFARAAGKQQEVGWRPLLLGWYRVRHRGLKDRRLTTAGQLDDKKRTTPRHKVQGLSQGLWQNCSGKQHVWIYMACLPASEWLMHVETV